MKTKIQLMTKTNITMMKLLNFDKSPSLKDLHSSSFSFSLNILWVFLNFASWKILCWCESCDLLAKCPPDALDCIIHFFKKIISQLSRSCKQHTKTWRPSVGLRASALTSVAWRLLQTSTARFAISLLHSLRTYHLVQALLDNTFVSVLNRRGLMAISRYLTKYKILAHVLY